MEFLSTEIWGNFVKTWLTALATIICVYLAIDIPRRLVCRRLTRLTLAPGVHWQAILLHILKRTRKLFIYIVAIWVGSLLLNIPPKAHSIIDKTTFVFLLVQLCIWGTTIISYWVEEDARSKPVFDGARAQSMRAVGFIATLVLYVVVFLWGLDNFGVNITALVAGLGVGGIAVALAVQNILGDLFASLTIVLDRPFVYGDYIIVDDKFKGHIEYVGLKTTRVRSIDGEQLIFPNSDLLQSRIRNFKRMQERRVLFTIGVSYDTKLEELKKIPADVKAAVESQEHTRFERCHLLTLGASSLDYEVVYWVLDPSYNVYSQTHQAVLLQLVAEFSKRGIDFAYPTQIVRLKQDTPPPT